MADDNWEDALVHLHEMGWETDDIDAACDTLVEACTDGDYEGNEPSELDDEQLEEVLGGDYSARERQALASSPRSARSRTRRATRCARRSGISTSSPTGAERAPRVA